MRAWTRSVTFRLLVVLLLSTIVAAVLFPWIWRSMAAMGLEMAEYPAPRVFRRVWMVAVLAGLILSRNHIGLQHPARVGLEFTKDTGNNAWWGVVTVWGFLFSLTILYVLAGAWMPRPDYRFAELFHQFYQGLLRGCLVALLEEYVFRGLIFRSLCRRFSWLSAAALASLIFSLLHFLDTRSFYWDIHPGSWGAGFVLCAAMVHHMIHRITLFPDALGLWLVGMILCYAVKRTGTLWYGIGLHGGWVWFVTFRGAFCYAVEGIETWYGGPRLFNGIYPMVGMLVIFPITHFLIQWGWLGGKSWSVEKE